ncbi:hypothetical protein Tco_0571641 [Tanacetum coccineum]
MIFPYLCHILEDHIGFWEIYNHKFFPNLGSQNSLSDPLDNTGRIPSKGIHQNHKVLVDIVFTRSQVGYSGSGVGQGSALPTKWRPKVTANEESKDLSTLSLNELIRNLKVYEVMLEKDSEMTKSKKEKYKTLALNPRRNQAMKKLPPWEVKMKSMPWRDCPKRPQRDQKAFIGGAWSDSEEEEELKKDGIYLMAHESNEGFSPCNPWDPPLETANISFDPPTSSRTDFVLETRKKLPNAIVKNVNQPPSLKHSQGLSRSKPKVQPRPKTPLRRQNTGYLKSNYNQVGWNYNPQNQNHCQAPNFVHWGSYPPFPFVNQRNGMCNANGPMRYWGPNT